MTDSTIIKALEKEIQLVKYVDGFSADNVSLELLQHSLDLINRLNKEISDLKIELQAMRNAANSYKAEIERLKEKNNRFADIGKMYSEIKSEAIKDFAKKVLDEIREAIMSNDKAIKEREEKHNVNRYEDNFCSMCDGKISALGGIRYFINNLVKEMVGE